MKINSSLTHYIYRKIFYCFRSTWYKVTLKRRCLFISRIDGKQTTEFGFLFKLATYLNFSRPERTEKGFHTHINWVVAAARSISTGRSLSIMRRENTYARARIRECPHAEGGGTVHYIMWIDSFSRSLWAQMAGRNNRVSQPGVCVSFRSGFVARTRLVTQTKFQITGLV